MDDEETTTGLLLITKKEDCLDDDDSSSSSDQMWARGGEKVWAESKKLWRVAGPAIFTRVVTYSMNVITQAFAGHLGDLELASMSIANTVVVGFNFGLLMAPRGRGRPYQGRPDPDDDVPDNNDDDLEEEAPHDNTGMRVLRGTTSKHFSNPEDTRLATDLLRARWFQPWAYWKEVPADERERLWQQFIGHFTCSNEDLPLIRRTWEATMQRRITGIISQERAEARRLAKSDDVMKMRQFKPSYMPQDVWNVLLDRTSEEAFKRRSEAARKNRLTLKEGEITKHTAGSIPFTTYRERMVSEDGTVPSQLEVFKRTHMKKGTESYIDARSKKFVEDYNAAASERCGESSSHPIDIDAEAWMKAAGDSGKGRVYGFTHGDSPGVLSRASSQSRASRVSRGIRIRDDEASGGQPTQGSQEMLDAVEATVTRQITQMRTDLEASITTTMNAAMRKAMRYLKRKDKDRDT